MTTKRLSPERLAVAVALLCSSCSLAVSEPAVEACESICDAFDAMVVRCNAGNAQRSPKSMCDRAVSFDEAKLKDDCLPWLETRDCSVGASDAEFRSHCDLVRFHRF